jgi:aspartate aminotransferase
VVYTREEFSALASGFKESGIYIISDEIYEKVIYDGREHVSIGTFEEIRDQVLTVNGVSKAYAMTGWRIGYLGGAPSVVRNAAKIQSQVTSCNTSISQKAAVAALNGNNTEIDAMTDRFRERRDFVFSSLCDTQGLEIFRPEGAFYFLLGPVAFATARMAERR